MVKTVTVKNVDEADWDVITALARRADISMAELVHVIAERIRALDGEGHGVDAFRLRQIEQRRQFIYQQIFGPEKSKDKKVK